MKDVFTRKMFYVLLRPSIIASAGLALANIADSLVTGIHIGETGLAAIGIVMPLYMIYALFYVGIEAGGVVEHSHMLGAGKKEDAMKLFNMLLSVSIAVGLLFTIAGIFFTKQILFFLGTSPDDGDIYYVSYDYAKVLLISAPVFFINTPLYGLIRSDGYEKLAALGFVVGNVLDVILNVVFVIGLDMGVQGTVYSTVTGQCVSVLIYIICLLGKDTTLKIRLVKPQVKLIFHSLKMGLSTSSQYIFQFIFIISVNHILMKISDDSSVAVFDVVLNISYIGLFLHNASNETLQILASTFWGEKNHAARRMVKKAALFFSASVGSLWILLIASISPLICSVFQIQSEMGSNAIRIYCLSAIIGGVLVILGGYYQSVERELLAFVMSVIRTFVCPIGFALVFSYWGVDVIWWLFPASELVSLLALIIINKFGLLKGKSEKFDENRILSFQIVSSQRDVKIPVEEIERFCGKWDASFKQTYYVSMVVEEICGAVVNNAFSGTNDIYLQIILIAHESGEFELHIRDNASQFNPFDLKTKKVSLEDTDEELGGLGVMMVKEKAKFFYYRRFQGFNTLTVSI